MECCPNCRSRNISNDSCERCGCKLLILSKVKAHAYKITQLAIEHKLSGSNKEAEDFFNRALRLYNCELIRQLKNFTLTTDLDDWTGSEKIDDCNMLDNRPFLGSTK